MDNSLDIGLKIGTDEENFWMIVKEKAEKDIKGNTRQNALNDRIIIFCDEKIKEEQEKSK